MNTPASATPNVNVGGSAFTLEQLDFYVKKISESSGFITLSREHVITLNQYYQYAHSSSSDAAVIAAWLVGRLSDHPDIPPIETQDFFEALSQHAAQWPALAGDSKNLANYLASDKAVLPSVDRKILSHYVGQAEADSTRRWRDVLSAAPTNVEAPVQADVQELANFLNGFQREVAHYQGVVATILDKAVRFRTTLSEQLIPLIKNKFRRLMKGSVAIEEANFFRDFYNLTREVARLEVDHRRAMQDCEDSFTEASGIPLEKMDALRGYGKRLLEARDRRTAMIKAVQPGGPVCDELTNLILLFSTIATQLEDVRAGANHLHTAWGCIDSYVGEARERILQLKDSHGLAAFMVNFNVFRLAWDEVREKAKRALIVFSEADADTPIGTPS